MLRLSRLARRSAFGTALHYARPAALLTRAVLPTGPTFVRRASSGPDNSSKPDNSSGPDNSSRDNSSVPDNDSYIAWNAPQQIFARQLLDKLSSPDVLAQIQALDGPEAEHFGALMADISLYGARDSMSIGRVLGFISEYNINLDGPNEVHTAEADKNAMSELDDDLEAILKYDQELGPFEQAEGELSPLERYTEEQLEAMDPDELEALLEEEQAYIDDVHHEKGLPEAPEESEDQQEVSEAQDGAEDMTPEEDDGFDGPQYAGNKELLEFDIDRDPKMYDDTQESYHYWPDLMRPDPLMDSRDILDLPPDLESPYHNRVVIRNDKSMFHEAFEVENRMREEYEADLRGASTPGYKEYIKNTLPGQTYADKFAEVDENEQKDDSDLEMTGTDLTSPTPAPATRAGVSENFLQGCIHIYKTWSYVSHQSGKGKVARGQCHTIVGNGAGLLGYGRGTHAEAGSAEARSFAQAVKNMDYVDRFENRTIWTNVDSKFGACRIIMRPRPLGFGLRCNPVLHRIFRAAGISDISAKVWKSRNPTLVTQNALKMLQAGHNPLGKGAGNGKAGRRLDKGSGLRNAHTLSRARGRYIVPLRK